MKKWIFLLTMAMFCMNLSGCGKKAEKLALQDRYENEVDPITIDGEEVDVKEYVIECLKEYIQREDYLERCEEYGNLGGADPQEFTVTRVIEVQVDDLGETRYSAHFIVIKANYTWGADGVKYDGDVLGISYVTGEIYSQFDYDESWRQGKESWKYCWNNVLNGQVKSSDYNGGTIITDRETRTELSQTEIDEINEALRKK